MKHIISDKKYVVFLLAVVAVGTEIVLRILGYPPGVFRQIEGFRKVDSLRVYHNFTTDDFGIYKFSPWVSDSLLKHYDEYKDEVTNAAVNQAVYTENNLDDLVQITGSYKHFTNPAPFRSFYWRAKDFLSNQQYNNAVYYTYAALLKTTPPANDEWHQAVVDYLHHPFNSDGFRSVAFKKHRTHRKRILIIGDSFVYGMSAAPYLNSFCDVLLTKGFMVYAAGIPGTDPAQYEAIARKYIPLLQPDAVVVCFYSGNDMMSHPRTPHPSQPYEYITNAGFFQSTMNGKHYSATDAYNQNLSLISIPQNGSLLNGVLSKTAITTLLWGGLRKMNITQHPVSNLNSLYTHKPLQNQIAITKTYIDKINTLGSAANTPVVHAIIPPDNNPTHPHTGYILPDTALLQGLFGNNYFFPDSFELKKHFPKNDYHFNNAGQQKFAAFLERILNQLPKQ